jgi:hypothetical protein
VEGVVNVGVHVKLIAPTRSPQGGLERGNRVIDTRIAAGIMQQER